MNANETDADAGAIALLRCLPQSELESTYRRAKADATDAGQHAAALIGRELVRRMKITLASRP
jgi:hypothetical protein